MLKDYSPREKPRALSIDALQGFPTRLSFFSLAVEQSSLVHCALNQVRLEIYSNFS